MALLDFYATTESDELAWPQLCNDYNCDSPASQFFIDYNSVKPITIENHMSAAEVEDLMMKAHLSLNVVVDSENKFKGIISRDTLNKMTIIQKTSGGVKWNDLDMSEFMTKKNELKALDYSDVMDATIGDIISTLKDFGEPHCLVVDRDEHRIRGVFSVCEIAKQLNMPIVIQKKTANYYKSCVIN